MSGYTCAAANSVRFNRAVQPAPRIARAPGLPVRLNFVLAEHLEARWDLNRGVLGYRHTDHHLRQFRV